MEVTTQIFRRPAKGILKLYKRIVEQQLCVVEFLKLSSEGWYSIRRVWFNNYGRQQSKRKPVFLPDMQINGGLGLVTMTLIDYKLLLQHTPVGRSAIIKNGIRNQTNPGWFYPPKSKVKIGDYLAMGNFHITTPDGCKRIMSNINELELATPMKW